MAIVHFVKHKRTQTIGGLNGVLNYCCKASKVDYEGRPLVSGINCVPQCAHQEFMNTKRLHHSTKGRLYYHMVQSFRPDDPVTPEQAHEIALKLAEQIPGFEMHHGKEFCPSHRIRETELDARVQQYAEELRSQWTAEQADLRRLHRLWEMKRPAIQAHIAELYDEIQRLEQEIDDLLLEKIQSGS